MPKIEAKSCNVFEITNFNVSPELMGQAHTFNYDELNVTIRLPQIDQADTDAASVYGRWADTDEPISFFVHKVEIEIELPDLVSVPAEALTNPPIQIDHFTENQENTIRSISKKYSSIAEKAFNYWIETIRWASDNAFIGQDIIHGRGIGGLRTDILNRQSNHRVWVNNAPWIVKGAAEVKTEHWMICQEYLLKGSTIPLHLRFLYNAQESTRNDYFEKSIIELAMSCETYLRYSVFKHIPQNLPKELVTYVEEANINKYASQFFKNLVPEESKKDYQKIQKDISSLMSKRNSYVHMGFMEGANQKNCNRYIESLKNLFKIQLTKP